MAVDPELVELRELVKKLEARITNLEKIIRIEGHRKILDFGTSKIVADPTTFKIETQGNMNLKASGKITLKGSRVLND